MMMLLLRHSVALAAVAGAVFLFATGHNGGGVLLALVALTTT